jgi:hypothetical protein
MPIEIASSGYLGLVHKWNSTNIVIIQQAICAMRKWQGKRVCKVFFAKIMILFSVKFATFLRVNI